MSRIAVCVPRYSTARGGRETPRVSRCWAQPNLDWGGAFFLVLTAFVALARADHES
jgi:hypothetical protein